MFSAANGLSTALTEGVLPIAFAHAYLFPFPIWSEVLGLDENSPFGRTAEVADSLHRAVVLSQRRVWKYERRRYN
jgi:hypothetical protein